MNQRKQTAFHWPAFSLIVPDLIAFAIGLGTAWLLDWKTTDLVWSLWLSSLVLGYLTILSTIGAGVYIGITAIAHEGFPKNKRLTAILIGSAVALFFLGFFSIHFCGFHAGHAAFLSGLFPLQNLPANAFGNAFMNPFLLWKTVFRHLLPLYGVFLVSTIIAERKYIFSPLLNAVNAVRAGPVKQPLFGGLDSGKTKGKGPHDPFFRPYINVIRMHILIFFFAICHALKVDTFIVFSTVYSVYFFPWSAFKSPSN